MENKELFELADQLKAAKDRKKELDALTKENNAEIERLDLALSEGMTEAECDRFSRNGGLYEAFSQSFRAENARNRQDHAALCCRTDYGGRAWRLVCEEVHTGIQQLRH